MIQSIGYTEDGIVWMQMGLEVNQETHTGTLMLTPEMARQVSIKLTDAADLAEKTNVRNSSNTH